MVKKKSLKESCPIQIALDPGNEKTGWVSFRPEPDIPGGLEILEFGITPNYQVREMLRSVSRKQRGMLVIETPKPAGQLASSELFETCIMIGRFLQTWAVKGWSYVHRDDVKYHLTRMAAAKDKNVSQALKDRFGGESVAVGGKKCKHCGGKGWKGRGRPPCPACKGNKWHTPPGPLHGITSHVWAALAVACYHVDNPRSVQAIMLKGARQSLARQVEGDQPLTAALRRKFGLAGRNKKKK